MKTLILNGSPRKNGETSGLITALERSLTGSVEIVRVYGADIAPCVDCRRCRTRPGCAIDDEMTALYETIRTCDNLVLASPLYFRELTGRLLDVASRLQTFYCARMFRGEDALIRPKRGALLLVGGSDRNTPDPAVKTGLLLLREMGCVETAEPVVFLGTDKKSALEDAEIPAKLRETAAFLCAAR